MARVVQLALPAHSATLFLRGRFSATMLGDHQQHRRRSFMPEQNWRVNVPFADHADRTRTDAILKLANETFHGFGQANGALQDPSVPVIGHESGAAKGDERRPINQRACNFTVSESLIPFHEQAQDEGTYVLAERAREADRARPKEPLERPSENSD
jgi:Domain of unknown function (DUF1876)